MSYILGVNGPPIGMHDASAAILDENGKVLAFAEEERFSRIKHALRCGPLQAIRYCLDTAGIDATDVESIAIGWDLPKFHAQDGLTWGRRNEDDFLRRWLAWPRRKRKPEVVYVPHHLAHATAAFYASGFNRAAVLVVDGQGEREATSIYRAGFGRPLELIHSWPKAHSIGFMYDAASRWLGFTFLEAGQTMGLAAYGRARSENAFPLLVASEQGYIPTVDLSENDYWPVIRRWEERIRWLAGAERPERGRDELHLDPRAVQVALSVQIATETAVTWLADYARTITGEGNLCLVGGVALNSCANALIPDPLYVPPCAHDAGVSLGAAWHLRPPSEQLTPLTPYLGVYADEAAAGIEAARLGLRRGELDIDSITNRLAAGEVGAVVEGRAEVGPRALCHRSIIALPTDVRMRDRINALKGREPWRPFGPVALPAVADDLWHQRASLDRYMVGTAAMTPKGAAQAPAVCHVDGTTRPQVLDVGRCKVVEAVLQRLQASGIPPVLINTSFNHRGEPIVNTATDAIMAFSRLDLDFLILEGQLFTKHSAG
jgi:carbamoyltransferase